MGRTKSERIADITELARGAAEIQSADSSSAAILRQVMHKERQLLNKVSKGHRKPKKKGKKRRKSRR